MNPAELLSLPTDSLYKFMAMSGLTILVISIVIPFYLKKQFLFKLYDLRKVHDITKLNVNKLKSNLKEIKNKEGVSAEKLNNFENNADKIESEQIETECELKKIEYLSSSITYINWFAIIGVATGSALTASGFYLWYIRLQVFLDKAVINGITP